MRRTRCPTDYCRRPLIYFDTVTHVQCRYCNHQPVSTERLRDVVEAKSTIEQFEWVQEKAVFEERTGGAGKGRARMINRSIDGLGGNEAILLGRYFNDYGVTDDGRVKKLREMGRSEPINLVVVSGYTFGIRNEHVDVAGYGPDLASTRYQWKLITEIGRLNGIDDRPILVPLSLSLSFPWLFETSCLISRACVGREVFHQSIAAATLKHLVAYVHEYQKRCDCDDTVWEQIFLAAQCERGYMFPACDLDLAAISNLICRPILLLDVKPQPHPVGLFVPFLWKPNECDDRDGKKRTPLLLAWSDANRRNRVALVSTADRNGVAPVRLPRSWFKPVWGVDPSMYDHVLNKYLDFDYQDWCLVANGKYFKPEYLKRFVKAFERVATAKDGIHPWVKSEFTEDVNTQMMENMDSTILHAGLDNTLWRCLKCERLMLRSDDVGACVFCGEIKHMRIQRLDGSVVYRNGDHTSTSAPNSWCFLKRKHFFDGAEYDNPPMTVEAKIDVNGAEVTESSRWFSEESISSRNSDVYEIAANVARKLGGVALPTVAETVRAQIEIQLDQDKIMNHKAAHLKDTLGNLFVDELLDNWKLPTFGEDLNKPNDVDEIFAAANEAYADFVQKKADLQLAVDLGGMTTDLRRKFKEVDDEQSTIDENTFQSLDNALRDMDQEQRWRRILVNSELFRQGGLYFHWAQKAGYGKGDHFVLPLLGETKYAFSDTEDALVVCLPGDHCPVHESVDVVCLLAGADFGNCEYRKP